jgi:hypothetical protein
MTKTGDVTFQRLAIDSVDLDVGNPRIARWIEMYGGKISAEQMGLALGAADSSTGDGGTTFVSLRESIKTHGRIIHPILVNREATGRLVVIEGNTRVLIYREFKRQGVEGDWDEIPAMVYSDLSPQDIDAIRLQAHLVGPRQWDPYSKARYLKHLRDSEHLTLDQVVDFCGGEKKVVLDYIAAFNDIESTYRPLLDSDDQFDPTRFSSFVELQRPSILQAIMAAGFTKTDFAQWVKDGLISPQAMVRSLPRILRNSKSKDIFLRDGAQEAVKVLDIPSADAAIRDASLEQLARVINRKVLSMEYAELQRLRSDVNAEEAELLCELKDNLIQLCSDIVSDE